MKDTLFTKKNKKLSVIFKCAGIVFFVSAILFFCLSFLVKRDIQASFGFSAIGFMPCGVFLLAIGTIFEQRRSVPWIIGFIFKAIGIVLFFFSVLLLFGIFITIFGFGTKTIFLHLLWIAFVSALAFIVIGDFLCRKGSSAKIPDTCPDTEQSP